MIDFIGFYFFSPVKKVTCYNCSIITGRTFVELRNKICFDSPFLTKPPSHTTCYSIAIKSTLISNIYAYLIFKNAVKLFILTYLVERNINRYEIT